MPKAGNFFFIRSTRIPIEEVLRIDGNPIWTQGDFLFQRIDQLCGEGMSRLFAEPTIKPQDGGKVLNIAWFGSYDDDTRDIETLDRVRNVRLVEELTRRIEALRPALADPQIGEAVAVMLNIYNRQSIVAVGDQPVILNWGSLPESATLSSAAYAKHTEATIGPFLKTDISPRLPGRSWTAAGGIESTATPAEAKAPPGTRSGAAAAAISTQRPSPARLPLWPPAVFAGVFGSILAYAAWPGNLIYEKQMAVSQAELDATANANRGLKERIELLTAQLGKDPCEIDKSLLALAAPSPGAGPDKPGSVPGTTPGAPFVPKGNGQ
ncbi:hypothetical protein [Rhizobium sp. C4]|uniref:hypothetical protein n=1 Tax=Rhizobium sp. C4 TaxID=1349800 RepID=UPI001E635B7E|nr:hypothetical protein [Rhizobium sp. C4]MCD2176112.1 hypothetical protein [Rhizobium sp. C4]